MTVKSDASLRGRARALAEEYGLSAQEVVQRYFFEHLLMRLAVSRYRRKFILKGGLLLSSMLGVAQRTTMDMDATVRSMSLDDATLSAALREICSIEVDDGIAYELGRIESIREGDDYGGLRAHVSAVYGRMRTPLKVDVTTGDAITPGEVEYSFPTLFGDGTVDIMAYPLETLVAEKYEAIVKRGAATTRARDLYDIATLFRLYAERIDWGTLRNAVRRTADRRGSLSLMADYARISEEIGQSDEIGRIWGAYVRLNPYAADVTVPDAMDSVRAIGDRLAL